MKINFRIFIAIFGIYFNSINVALAQKLTGYVYDIDSGEPIEMANIVLTRTQEGSLSDRNGRFEINVRLFDTLVFMSINYEQKQIIITRLGLQYFKLKAKMYNIDEVKIEAKEEVPIMYRSNVFPGEDPHLLYILSSPASYLYYKFSDKEKSKKKVRDDLVYQKRLQQVYAIYNKDLVAEFTGLTGKELDDCFIYCSANIGLNENDTEFSIKYKLLEVLAKYNDPKK